MYDGDCTIMKYDKTGKVSGKEDDVAVFMQIEGGFLCATVLCVLLVRLHARQQERSRTQQNTKIDLMEQKIFDRLLFISKLVLYAVNFGLCITGMLPVKFIIYKFCSKKKYLFCGIILCLFWNN